MPGASCTRAAAALLLALGAAGCTVGAPAGHQVGVLNGSGVTTDTGSSGAAVSAPPDSRSVGATAGGQQDLPAAALALALTTAHQEAGQIAVGGDRQQVAGWPTGITAVTVAVRRGTVVAADSNTGHQCASGTMLLVGLVGSFNAATTGYPTEPGKPAADTTIRQFDLSVDGSSGATCLIIARTTATSPGADGHVLFSR